MYTIPDSSFIGGSNISYSEYRSILIAIRAGNKKLHELDSNILRYMTSYPNSMSMGSVPHYCTETVKKCEEILSERIILGEK